MKKTVVLSYSGGLDTSCAIRWLQETYQMNVVAVMVDVGQNEDLPAAKQKALDLGALEAYLLDRRQEFAEQYVFPALQANALYEGVYPLVSALSRPLIAREVMQVAERIGAAAVAHGCTGKGNDQVRFDLSFQVLNPTMQVIAPIREWSFSRLELLDYAKEKGVPVPVTRKSPYSIDANLWGRSIESGVLEDPMTEPPADAFSLTVDPGQAPDEPRYLEIGFEQGIPVSIDGERLFPVELIASLNQIVGGHGVGRIDHIESRLVGIKSREVYEAPAALFLITAHQALEALTLPRELLHLKRSLEMDFARCVYFGLWFSPMVEAICRFVEATQEHVSGTVRLKLFKGGMRVVGKWSERALYQKDLATYGEGDAFDHKAAEGFIRLYGLETMLYAGQRRKHEGMESTLQQKKGNSLIGTV